MNDNIIREIFEHSMIRDGHVNRDCLFCCDGQYVLDDIREMFRGFKLGWNAARYLAEVEVGLQCADDGQLTQIEEIKAKWQEFQPWMR